MVTLTDWRERMSEDMRLRDFRPRTQEGYLLAVRLFIERLAREPDALTDDDVRRYFLYLREDRKLAPSMHVTQPGVERLQETLDRLMADL
ncbi:MAG: site-specific integrase [Polyangiaceae bacterium]